MSDKGIKVTDKRIFTPEGELKEEYRFLEDKANAPTPPETAPEPPPPPPAGSEPGPRRRGEARPEPPQPAPEGRRGAPEPSQAAPGGRPGGRGMEPGPGPEPEDWAAAGPPLELPGSPPGMAPTFYDLAAVLAEPVAVYLGDVDYEGQSAENLEMARLHIDLLDVLRQKTMGNLTAQEAAFLEDLLYRLRVRYVQKRG